MSVNIGQATVNIVPSMKNFTSTINKAMSSAGYKKYGEKSGKEYGGGFSSVLSTGMFGGIAASLTSTVTSAIGSLTGEMAAASDSAQKFASTLSFGGVDTKTIDALTKSTQEYADKTVYDLQDIRNVTAQLASNGVDNYAQLAEAAGNLNAVAGGNANTFQSVGQVMTQTAGAGKLMTENWRQLTDAIPGVSGPLQEAMREAGAFEGNFSEAMANGEISADEFFAAVQKLGMQDVAVQAATSTSTIEGAMGNLQASVVGLGASILTGLTPAITGAMTSLSTFIAGIPAALAPLGQAIMTALSGGGTEGIATAMTTLFTNIGTSLTTAMTTFGAQLPTIMQAFVPTLMTALTSLLTNVLTQLPTILMSFIGMVTSGISSFISELGATLPTVLPPLIEAAMTAVNDLITQILTNLPTYIDQMVQAALDLFQGIVDAIPEIIPKVVDGITDLVENVLEHLPSFLDSMIQAAVDLFTGIVEAIPEVVPAVLDGITDLLTQVWDTITSFDLVGAGKDLIQGLIDGIASMAGAVIDAIGSVVGDAIDWAKGLLGIGSPSKLFRQFGDWTMQGLALGIGDGTKDAVGAMKSAMRSVYGGTAAAALAAPEMAGGSYGAARRGTLAAQQAQTVNQTINFNQPVSTPYQMAREMRRYATYGLAGSRG